MITFFRHIRQSLIMKNQTGKYFKYAIGEIFLVVIGILIALQVNNWNEERLEKTRIKKYAKSLIQDLENDIKMLNISRIQAEKTYSDIDSLKNYIRITPTEELSNIDLLILTHDNLYRPFKWNRSTFDEIKSSGSLRYITNDSLEKKIVEYEAFARHLDEDFSQDKNSAAKVNDIRVTIINFNSAYLDKLLEEEKTEIGLVERNLFEKPHYKIAKENDLQLLTYNITAINTLVNRAIIIQNQLRTRAFLELPNIIRDAQHMIALLKQEYQIEDD